MARTLFDKIWDAHLVGHRPDGRALLYMDRHVLHDLHAPRAYGKLTQSGRSVRRPDLTVGVQDHLVSTAPGRNEFSNPDGVDLALAMREGSRQHGIRLLDVQDAEQGIVHVVAPEQGLALPGATLACPDSHACTVGGVGTLAFGCGTTDLEHVLATQVMAIKKPKQLRIRLDGALGPSVTGKDVILHVISILGQTQAAGFAVEFCGPVVRAMGVESRLTLCNMTTEMGGRTALVAPDEVTFAYLNGRPAVPEGAEWDRAVEDWKTLFSDDDAVFDRDVVIDCNALGPQITWGTDPSQTVDVTGHVPQDGPDPDAFKKSLDYMDLASGTALDGVKINRVFIGSCTNARLSDLESAAEVARGRHVAAGVRAIVVPGSTTIKRMAEAKGLDRIFLDAGFEWRESGCSMCAGANGDEGAPGDRCVSTANRNFENRQGRGVRTHLASPAMAAAAAVSGHIIDVRRLLAEER